MLRYLFVYSTYNKISSLFPNYNVNPFHFQIRSSSDMSIFTHCRRLSYINLRYLNKNGSDSVRPLLELNNIGNTGTIPRCAKQPSEIRACPSSDRMARRNFKNNYYCRNVRRHLRKYLESVYRLYQCRSGKDQTDIYTARKPQACAYKSCTAFLCSGNHKQYESQYRTLSCGSHYRRISRCQKRTWISDHLFQSGI